MSKLNDINYLHQLYDTYGSLLTSKQKDNFELYYFEDLSLAEIAEELNISRNAVHNNLQASINHLNNYEENLNIVSKKNMIIKYLKSIENDSSLEKEKINKIIEML
ncbi:putative DNA-binding protein YlxM (UPF0122 family) [Bacilli bacterium PM5-3]|nr:putative DNA-binding protein YlxM (UPF0122 family) [Bacilli bacterium PM5-3]MDH6602929.1 putative DNA-binding protein YlxM (UPF0122 family) [Bacilli bacterium PM5-9]